MIKVAFSLIGVFTLKIPCKIDIARVDLPGAIQRTCKPYILLSAFIAVTLCYNIIDSNQFSRSDHSLIVNEMTCQDQKYSLFHTKQNRVFIRFDQFYYKTTLTLGRAFTTNPQYLSLNRER